MPYIEKWKRTECDDLYITDPGMLNYVISLLVNNYFKESGVSYSNINEVVGVLECAKLELYRRVAAPYEDKKKEENGEVYTVI
jgi:hypothetical protein